MSRKPEPSPLDNQPTPQEPLARTWRRYLRFWGARPEADVDDELRFHLDMRVRDYMERGMTERDARAAAERRFGDVPAVHGEMIAISTRREKRTARSRWWDALVQDTRYAFRTFGRQKSWTAIAVLTLALGIGANTAVFSAVNSLILHPLPYPDLDRVVNVWMKPTQASAATGPMVRVSTGEDAVRTWIEGVHSFEQLEPFNETDVTVEQRDAPTATMHAAYIRPTFPRFAGERVLLGRMFTQSDMDTKQPVLLLGESAWRTRFGSDTTVIGRSITVNDQLHTIIGVLPATLKLPQLTRSTADIWIPLQLTRGPGFSVIGRLREGITYAQATSELDSLYNRTAARGAAPAPFRVNLTGPREMVSFKQSLILLTGAVALVLLIACTNVAHLLLARSASRQRELAIRRALGAGTGRLVRQTLTESIVLSLAGCATGIFLGWLAIRMLVRLRPNNLQALAVAHVNGTVLIAIVGLALITGIGFGVFAAFQTWRHSTHESLKTGALTTSQSRSHHRMRSLLVVTEMALSTTLLVGASLLVRSVVNLQTTSPGFEPRGLYALQPNLPEARYANGTAKSQFYDAVIARLHDVRGVEQIALTDGAPPGFNFMIGGLQVEGDPPPKPGTTSFIRYVGVSPNYFRTMRLAVVEGRAYVDSTGEDNVVMVNQGFAKAHWPGQSALGKRIRYINFGGDGTWSTVIGVVADAATGGLTDDRTAPILYFQTIPWAGPSIVVRTTPGVDLLPAMRSIISSLDRHLPPPTLTNIEDAMNATAAEPRFTMALLVAFTVLALVLAAVGLYGVMSYGVAQRTREIGIRIALGATRRDVSRDVVWNGVVLAFVGAAIGLVGAWWATKVVEKMLYGVTRTDPLSFAIGAAVLLATAIAACIVPMNRAASVDPLIAMRAD